MRAPPGPGGGGILQPCPSVEVESHRRTGTSEPRAGWLAGLITPLPKQPTHWVLAMLGRWDRRRPGAVPRCASRWGRKPCLPCNLIFNLTSSSSLNPSLVPATRRLRLLLASLLLLLLPLLLSLCL